LKIDQKILNSKNTMTRDEQILLRQIRNRANSFEANNADQPAAVNKAAGMGNVAGNPGFVAQFDVQFIIKYFTVAAGVYTGVLAAAIAAALKTQLPAFLFGNTDFAGGFAKLQSQFILTGGWAYDTPFVYGKDYAATVFGALDATAKAALRVGDLVIPVWATTAGPVNTVGFTIVRCTQVAYGTLLDALNSDMFTINTVRYIMSDTTAVGLAQYNNNINMFNQSLFGKFKSDFVSPNSFKVPEQMQTGIIDIPLVLDVNKQVALGTFINYDIVNVQWSIFANVVNKLSV
jgi:hypothetical protein